MRTMKSKMLRRSDQTREIIRIRMPESVTCAIEKMPETMEDSPTSTRSATVGEKSKAPIRKKEKRRKRFRYGSHTEQKKRPTGVYSEPGIHVRIMRMKQRSVKIDSAPEIKRLIVYIIFLLYSSKKSKHH
jgi:hypothetical protein